MNNELYFPISKKYIHSSTLGTRIDTPTAPQCIFQGIFSIIDLLNFNYDELLTIEFRQYTNITCVLKVRNIPILYTNVIFSITSLCIVGSTTNTNY